jgi:hypothetical protein
LSWPVGGQYIGPDLAQALDARCEEILAQLSTIIRDADRWCTAKPTP